MKRARHWLKGDCHLHTCNSDGKLKPEELYDLLFEAGMDFAFITDHNVNTPGMKAFNHRGVAIFPGMEITGNFGHVNIWGENLPFERISRPSSPEEYLTLIDAARKCGAHVSVNHPCDRKFRWRVNPDSFDMDSVEVWNSPMHTDNIYAFRWWEEKLIEGKFIPAVGGSDFHRDYYVTDLLGVPTTYVYAQSNSIEDILAAIKRGNVFVTNATDAPKLFLTCGDSVPGDSVSFAENKAVNISVERLRAGQTLRVYHNGNIIYEYKAKISKKNFSADVDVPSEGFVRADVSFRYSAPAELIYRKTVGDMKGLHDKDEPMPDMIFSFTNPIFFTK